MREGLTELVFILDKSGWVNGLEKEAIGGAIRQLVKTQKMAAEESRAEKAVLVIT
ncbi:MAG: hypothetical protein LBE49_09705 [Deltaproteobacteria bacterium]|nr:hypothetical protein [Deltaproteobacteria bacterium]